MYIKIQKENSDNYLIFEGKEIETTKFRFPMTNSEYLNFLKEKYCIIEASKEPMCAFAMSEYNNQIRETLSLKDEKIVTNYSSDMVQEMLDHPDKYVHCSGSLACVKVDGQQYITFGKIYVLNDNGQTIQSF